MTSIYKDIPQPGDVLAVSQVDLNNNFTYLKNALNRDHKINYGVNTGVDAAQGFHRQVSFINGLAAVTPVPADATGLIYESDNGAGTPDFFWNAIGMLSSVKMTNYNMNNPASPGLPIQAANGCSFLPSPGGSSGMMIQWGTSTTDNALTFPATPTVTFTPAFSAAPYSIQVSIKQNTDAGILVQVASVSATELKVTTRDSGGGKRGNVTYSWLAIGPT